MIGCIAWSGVAGMALTFGFIALMFWAEDHWKLRP